LATRARLRQEIRRKVARIDFWFHRDRKTPHLVTNPKNDLFPFARVTFTNGQQRYIVLVENGFVTLAGEDNTTAYGSARTRAGATGPFP
jgi:hypothetical protein